MILHMHFENENVQHDHSWMAIQQVVRIDVKLMSVK